jgi:hypothetical protein
MAAIMDEWAAINQQVNKIGKALGIEVPPVLFRVEGNVFGRQSQRLNALSHFLKEVAGVVSETQKTKETQTEKGDKPKGKGKQTKQPKSTLKPPPKVIEDNPPEPSLPKPQTDV